MAELRLSLKMLARDWRAGELRVLALALLVAVASVTSVGFFADRVRQGLQRDAHQLLGADVLLVSDRPWRSAIREELARRGLQRAQTMTFVSMARALDAATLSGVKAVSELYPLRGKLKTAPALNAPDHDAQGVPGRGSVWIDERLAQALSLGTGDTLELGNSRLTVSAILTLEPDRSPSFFNMAPRLMMRVEDVPGTGLIQEGSRIRYYLLAAGERDAVQAFETWVKPRLERGETLLTLEEGRPGLRNALDRAQQFTGLTALLAVILAAVAVSLSTRRYTARHLDGCAVMRCLGASQSRLLRLCGGEFLVLGAAACALGSLVGFGAQYVIAGFVAELVGAQLPAPSVLPALQGVLTGMVLLLGFALPPLLQLKGVPALRVLRRDVGAPKQGALFGWALGLAAIGLLLVWQAGDVKLGLTVLGGFLGALGVFGAVAYLLLQLLGRAGKGVGITWRYGLANLRRHARANVVQILALSLGLTAVLILTFTREDLLATWQAKIPPDAPNRFLVNVQPDQREPLVALFRDAGLATPPLYPMVRGRFVGLNGEAVDTEDYAQHDRRLVEREFNLSYMDRLPAHNDVVAGRRYTADDIANGALSVEEGIARRLGWKLGDRLTWQVAGQEFTAPIVNLRKLDWDSMQVNFFVIATPPLLEAAPASFVTSFHLPEAKAAFTATVAKRFPNLTIVDMSALLRQAQSIVDQVVRAVQFVFLFALGAGILVLYSALLATQDERSQEAAVMRALGAARAQVLAAQRAEFVVLGLVAGALAAAGASVIGFAIARIVFQFPYQANHWVWVAGPLAGLACVALNVWAGARAALNQPPITALREV
ncbi:MAG: ABC transporter permease [Betaproteobacteria bacterium RIFCSPLOWO2_02_FULL_65_24]|nr:MAG: ABC transporter permease [Betaproteobacteria bacterium RIFCSPLOWO2_02_FULL_65_24]